MNDVLNIRIWEQIMTSTNPTVLEMRDRLLVVAKMVHGEEAKDHAEQIGNVLLNIGRVLGGLPVLLEALKAEKDEKGLQLAKEVERTLMAFVNHTYMIHGPEGR